MKKRFLIVLFSLGLLLIFSVNAMADDKAKADDTIGVYVAITGGVSFPSSMTSTLVDTAPGGGVINQDISLNTGWLVGAKVGWQTPFSKRWFAVEAEYNHMENSFDTGKLYNTVGVNLNYDSKVKVDTGLLNLIGRYPEGKIHPYVGAGVGYANVQLDDIRSSIVGINLLNTAGGSKGVFAYQFMVGCDFEITKNIFVGLGYKYFVTEKANFDTRITSPFLPGASDPGTVEVQYKSHDVALTVGYMF